MEIRNLLVVIATVASLLLSGCAPPNPLQGQSTVAPAITSTVAPTATSKISQSLELTNKDPQNATYRIDDKAIMLVNGVAEAEAAPDSASKQVTRYFGNAVDIDLNADGTMDSAFLLQQDRGGSGVFYFVVASLNTRDGYVGTNAIFIGDRIAPQNTMVDLNDPDMFIVNYFDRKADEPMSAQPSEGVSRWFKLEGDELVEVTSPPQMP